jgi:NADPH-dependent 2,4-dienoyl-CoA reductase/sulfur reductase-like enzyme
LAPEPLRGIVIVGASLAGLRAAEALRAAGYRGSLTFLGAEDVGPYDRPALSKQVLLGNARPEELTLSAASGLEATWRLGEPAAALDAVGRTIRTAGGDAVPFDGLVIATGSRPRALTLFGADVPSVHLIRTIRDAIRLRDVLSATTRLLIVGAGFVGVEVAAAARLRGADVTMVSLDEPLTAAGPLVSGTARTLLGRHGVHLHVGQAVATAVAVGGAHRVELDDGTLLGADHVVVAIGALPNTEWLRDSGLVLADGVACDAALRVPQIPGVVAAGDVARWPNPTFGGRSMRVEHWANAVEQGAAAARSLLQGGDAAPFASVPSFWSDHFGVRLQSVGVPGLADRFEVVAGSLQDGIFAAAGYSGDELICGVAYGMPRALAALRLKLASGAAERVTVSADTASAAGRSLAPLPGRLVSGCPAHPRCPARAGSPLAGVAGFSPGSRRALLSPRPGPFPRRSGARRR